jgi:hypothetical protein
MIQRILKSISAERHLKGLEMNWTNLLGQVMSVCNSCGMKKNSTSSYEAVFGQWYHPILRCSVSEMQKCNSIWQRLKLSPNERLQKYVEENDIVDIDASGAVDTEVLEDNTDNEDDVDEAEGEEINNNTFPGCDFEEEPVVLCQEVKEYSSVTTRQQPKATMMIDQGCRIYDSKPFAKNKDADDDGKPAFAKIGDSTRVSD